MTEERMLETSGPRSNSRTSWYSGLCSSCGTEFYTLWIESLYCSNECRPHTRGSDNTQWKGGRWKTKAGYIRLSGYQDHPRSNSGCVLEHTIVLEKHLGRYLKDCENVHHKNGIRDDNRLENLELWTTYQPFGQRVEDLLDFVVKNYPEEIKSKLDSKITPGTL